MPLSSLSSPARRLAALALLPLVGTAALVAAAPTAQAVDIASPVVISEVYGGGGNTRRAVHQRLHRALQQRHTAVDLSTLVGAVRRRPTGTSWTNKTNLSGSDRRPKSSTCPGGAGRHRRSRRCRPRTSPDHRHERHRRQGGAREQPDHPDRLRSGLLDGAPASWTSSASAPPTTARRAGPTPALSQHHVGPAQASARSPTPATTPPTSPSPRRPRPERRTTAPPAVDCAATPAAPACQPGTDDDPGHPGHRVPLAARGQHASSRVAGIVTAVRSPGSSRGFWIQQATPDATRSAASSGDLRLHRHAPSVRRRRRGARHRHGSRTSTRWPRARRWPPPPACRSPRSRPRWSPRQHGQPAAGGRWSSRPTTVPGRLRPAAAGGVTTSSRSPRSTRRRSALEFWEAHEGMLVRSTTSASSGPASRSSARST